MFDEKNLEKKLLVMWNEKEECRIYFVWSSRRGTSVNSLFAHRNSLFSKTGGYTNKDNENFDNFRINY